MDHIKMGHMKVDMGSQCGYKNLHWSVSPRSIQRLVILGWSGCSKGNPHAL